MAEYIPISGIVPQATANGNQANGMVWKFYEVGTLVPLSMATDSTGGTLTTEFVLNTQGYATLSSVIVIPHTNSAYKEVLYLNQTDADANDTGSAVYVIDNVSLGDAFKSLNADYDTLDDAKAAGGSLGDYVTTSEYSAGIGGGNLYKIVAGGGTADLGSFIDKTDGSGFQLQAIFSNTILASQFGATGDGTTDDTASLSSALAFGAVTHLVKGKTYKISSRLLWTKEKSGFICTDGRADILMTSAGFNATTYSGLAANSVGFECQNFDEPVLDGISIIFEAHGSDIRTAIAAAFRNVPDMIVDVEAQGFSEPESGIITIESCIGGRCYVNVHDCSSNNNTLPSLQITGLGVDNNRVSNIYSKGVDFGSPIFKNLTFGAAAKAAYGYQTDGVTLNGGTVVGGNGGCKFGVITVEAVYEGVDIQSSDHIIAGINAREINISPLKMVHGGRNNVIGSITSNNTGGAVVLFAGTDTSPEAADNNVITSIAADGTGSISDKPATAKPVVVHFDGPTAAVKPKDNLILGITARSADNPSMTSIVLDEAGTGNKVYDISGIGSTNVCSIDGTQALLDHVDIRKASKSFSDGYLSIDENVGNGTIIPFDAITFDEYSELDITDGIFKSVGPMQGIATASARTASLANGNYMELQVLVNGAIVARSRDTNDTTAGSRESVVNISTPFKLDNAANEVKIFLGTNGPAILLTQGSDLTNFTITEV